MRTIPNFKLIVATAVVAVAAAACWHVAQYHKHRIVVVFPDGRPALHASFSLDYDPIWQYHPMSLTANEHGVLHISREYAYGRGWDWMNVTAYKDRRRYYARRTPEDCKYPMTVVLQEDKPNPLVERRPGTMDQAREIEGVIRRVVSGLRSR